MCFSPTPQFMLTNFHACCLRRPCHRQHVSSTASRWPPSPQCCVYTYSPLSLEPLQPWKPAPTVLHYSACCSPQTRHPVCSYVNTSISVRNSSKRATLFTFGGEVGATMQYSALAAAVMVLHCCCPRMLHLDFSYVNASISSSSSNSSDCPTLFSLLLHPTTAFCV